MRLNLINKINGSSAGSATERRSIRIAPWPRYRRCLQPGIFSPEARGSARKAGSEYFPATYRWRLPAACLVVRIVIMCVITDTGNNSGALCDFFAYSFDQVNPANCEIVIEKASWIIFPALINRMGMLTKHFAKHTEINSLTYYKQNSRKLSKKQLSLRYKPVKPSIIAKLNVSISFSIRLLNSLNFLKSAHYRTIPCFTFLLVLCVGRAVSATAQDNLLPIHRFLPI